MSIIQKNKNLKEHNTFGLPSIASSFARIESARDLAPALEDSETDRFVLGGGSNILLPDRLEKLVLFNAIHGKKVLEENDRYAIVESGAGENWHLFVCWCLERDLGGIENLSLIPGTVGAAPIQNIGAYGVELQEVFHSLDAVDLDSLEEKTFYPEDCDFAYRHSAFKGMWKGRYFITRVRLQLTRRDHRLNTTYGAIREVLKGKNITEPGIRDIGEAVISIRRAKLPDWKKLGNSGSFFKNPVVNRDKFDLLRKEFPDLKYYELPGGEYKIPAGWMIDKCGWKGKRVGNVGCYEKQALVIVNYGGATAGEVRGFAEAVQDSVADTFGISLEPEVSLIDS